LTQTSITKCENEKKNTFYVTGVGLSLAVPPLGSLYQSRTRKKANIKKKNSLKSTPGYHIRRDHYYNSRQKAMSWFNLCVVGEESAKWGMVLKL
jgi:hypothetical protein